jgi:hypothetical protein
MYLKTHKREISGAFVIILLTLPQYYRCQPVDVVIRQRRTDKACYGKYHNRKVVEIYIDIGKQ